MSQAVITEAGRGDSGRQRDGSRPSKASPFWKSLRTPAGWQRRSSSSTRFRPRLPDALHIAVAVVMGMDYVLTWNCTHIANAAIRPKIEDACRKLGYEPSVICTPEELME